MSTYLQKSTELTLNLHVPIAKFGKTACTSSPLDATCSGLHCGRPSPPLPTGSAPLGTLHRGLPEGHRHQGPLREVAAGPRLPQECPQSPILPPAGCNFWPSSGGRRMIHGRQPYLSTYLNQRTELTPNLHVHIAKPASLWTSNFPRHLEPRLPPSVKGKCHFILKCQAKTMLECENYFIQSFDNMNVLFNLYF